jgi:4-amino-4-deoxy-L-arabinose transferase-like glycosyltransferase
MLRRGLFTLTAYISCFLLVLIFIVAVFIKTPVLLKTSSASIYLLALAAITTVFCVFCLIPKSRIRLSRKAFLAILLAAVILPRLFWVGFVDTTPYSDFKHMHDFGAAVSQGIFNRYVRFYELFPFKFNYGFILGALYKVFGIHVLAVKLFNVLLSAFAALLVWWIGRMTFTERTGRIAALLFAIWPAQVMYCSVVASEHVFLVFFLLGTGLFIRHHLPAKGGRALVGLAASGLFLALAQLIRPVATLMLAVLAVYLLVFVRYHNEKAADVLRKVKVLATVALIFVLTLSLVSWPVGKLTGVPSARSSSGVNLLIGTNSKTIGMFNEEDFSIIEEFQYDYDKVHTEATKRALDRIKSNPAGFGKLAVKKFAVLWGDEHYGYYWSTYQTGAGDAIGERLKNSPRMLAAAAQLHYFVVLLFAAAGCIFARRRLVYPVVIYLLTFGGIVAAYTFLEVQSRYHIPAIPFLLLLGAFGLEQLCSLARQKAGEMHEAGKDGKRHVLRLLFHQKATITVLVLITLFAVLLRLDFFFRI